MGVPEFYDLIASLEDLTDKQVLQILLNIRELSPSCIDSVQEAMASFNALTEVQVISLLTQQKAQYSSEDWATLLEII